MKNYKLKPSLKGINFTVFRTYWFFRVCGYLLVVALTFWMVAYILPGVLPSKVVLNSKISGLIIRNQVWGGNIDVIGDTLVVPGAKVTINPGTKVSIARKGDRLNFDFLPWHLKNGVNIGEEVRGIRKGEPFWDEGEKIQVHFSTLIARGTKENPISITSDDSPGSPYDINLITISKGSLQFVLFSNYRRLEIGPDVNISDSKFNNTGECAICISFGNPHIYNNIFQGSKRNYIISEMGSPVISQNKFLESEGDGILFSGDSYSNVVLQDNIFNMTNRLAVKVIPQDQGGAIAHNLFSSGDIELPCGSKVQLINNWIKSKVIFNNPTSCGGNYIVGANYWDIQDPIDILSSRIIGSNQQFKIILSTILKDPPQNFKN